MFKYARELFFLSMACFFVVLTLLSLILAYTVFGQKGKWVAAVASEVASTVIARQAAKRTKSSGNLAEKVVDRLLANDGKLVVKMIKQIIKRPKQGQANNQVLEKVLNKLLANDGHLVAMILAKMQKQRKNPIKGFFEKLLAQDARILTKVLSRVQIAKQRKQPSLPQMLLKKPKATARLVAEVMKQTGIKSILQTAKQKVRAINTKVSLQQEIRYALSRVPSMIAKSMSIRQKKKRLQNREWRKIKAQFPKIKKALSGSSCLVLVNLRKVKDNQIRARVRVKMLKPGCAKRACQEHVSAVDQAILKHTSAFGLHEGHIQQRYNLLKRKCNTNR